MILIFKLFLLFCNSGLRDLYREIEGRNAVNRSLITKCSITFAFALIFHGSGIVWVTYITISLYLETDLIPVLMGGVFVVAVIYFFLYREAFYCLESSVVSYADGAVVKGEITEKTPRFYGPLKVFYCFKIGDQKYKGYFYSGPWLFCYGRWKVGQEVEVIYAKSSPKYSQLYEKDKHNNMCLDKEKFI